MKTASLLIGLLACSAFTAFASPETSLLLIGQTTRQDDLGSVVSGQASAIVNSTGDDTRITADEIAYDATHGSLKCTGNVTIRSAGRTITSPSLTIEFGSAVKTGNVYVLNPKGIVLGASPEKQSAFEAWASKHLSAPLPTFDSRPELLPKQR